MSDQGGIAAIVLAAGASRRFGSDKLLHPVTLNGVTMPLAAHTLLPWLNAFNHITIVVRRGTERVCEDIEAALGADHPSELRWVVCEKAYEGMSKSLACGVSANLDAAGWVIGLADMPTVPLEAVIGVKHALLNGAHIVAPFCNHKRGHPVGFASCYREELLALKGDTGARHILERDVAKLVRVEILDSGIFTDIDSPDDLQKEIENE